MKHSGRNRLAEALEALKQLQESGKCFAIKGASVLGETNTKVLLANGFLETVLRGWYIPSIPAHAGTTVSWYACFWGFVAVYCHARFGEAWVLTPEESLMVWAGENVVPQQVVVQAAKGSNTVQPLLHGTSIFNFTTRIPSMVVKDAAYGLNVYPMAAALLRCSPSFYVQHADVVRSCLIALEPNDESRAQILACEGESHANRLIGALEAIGRNEMAAFVAACQAEKGCKVDPCNPFAATYAPVWLPERSPVAARIRLKWRKMREKVLAMAPSEAAESVRKVDEVLSEMDDGYVADSYHSLSIEGYQVSEELIRKVRDGEWDPSANPADENARNAMAASGYYRAYQKVRRTVERILRGEAAGELVASGLEDWHRELFMPWVDAGLLDEKDLRGYRRTQVYIAGSRYSPPAAVRVTDAMEAYLDLVRGETNALVRAVLGHFFLVHIHPYADGNGRTARFVMNASLVAGGMRWKIISKDRRDTYMMALEKASVKSEIDDFAKLVLDIT